MKKLVLALTLLVAGTQAHALRHAPTYQGMLNKFFLQVGTDLSKKDITSGYVKVDTKNSQITVILQPAFHCPNGAICAMVMPQAITLQVPIIDVKKGGCGDIIYKGEMNMLPVDGALIEITVIDNKNNFCELYPMIPTIVEIHSETGRPFKVQDHVIHGEYLQIVPMN